jgi:hypothetical protein
MDFFCTPSRLPGLKVTVIVPSPPGGISPAEASAAVHPQPALTFLISSAAVPWFLKTKSCVRPAVLN